MAPLLLLQGLAADAKGRAASLETRLRSGVRRTEPAKQRAVSWHIATKEGELPMITHETTVVDSPIPSDDRPRFGLLEPVSAAEHVALIETLAIVQREKIAMEAERDEAKSARELVDRDLRQLDAKHQRILRRLRESNPEPDEILRGVLSIAVGDCSQHERPYAERDLFEERLGEWIEKNQERRVYVLRMRFTGFTAIPTKARGSIGVDREWTASLILGSAKRELTEKTVGVSYEIDLT
jgi:hypothetical protein